MDHAKPILRPPRSAHTRSAADTRSAVLSIVTTLQPRPLAQPAMRATSATQLRPTLHLKAPDSSPIFVPRSLTERGGLLKPSFPDSSGESISMPTVSIPRLVGVRDAALPSAPLYCWGSNAAGQCAAEATGSPSVATPQPVRLPSLGARDAPVQCAAGGNHTTVLTKLGDVFAWGDNSSGQLGIALSTRSKVHQEALSAQYSTPKPIAGLKSLRICYVACGHRHSLALSVSGGVYEWGHTARGQLSQPSLLAPLARVRVRHIAAGKDFSCAVAANAQAWTWGVGSFGQLGHGRTVDAPDPGPVLLPSGASANTAVAMAACGDSHLLLLTKDGTVLSCGLNGQGQLGRAVSGGALARGGTWSPMPGFVEGFGSSKVTHIAAGGSSSAAIDSQGTLWLWGSNEHGQLCVGSDLVNSRTPLPVERLVSERIRIRHVSLGVTLAVATSTVGNVYTWGAPLSDAGRGWTAEPVCRPQLMTSFTRAGKHMAHAVAGGQHIAAVVEHDPGTTDTPPTAISPTFSYVFGAPLRVQPSRADRCLFLPPDACLTAVAAGLRSPFSAICSPVAAGPATATQSGAKLASTASVLCNQWSLCRLVLMGNDAKLCGDDCSIGGSAGDGPAPPQRVHVHVLYRPRGRGDVDPFLSADCEVSPCAVDGGRVLAFRLPALGWYDLRVGIGGSGGGGIGGSVSLDAPHLPSDLGNSPYVVQVSSCVSCATLARPAPERVTQGTHIPVLLRFRACEPAARALTCTATVRQVAAAGDGGAPAAVASIALELTDTRDDPDDPCSKLATARLACPAEEGTYTVSIQLAHADCTVPVEGTPFTVRVIPSQVEPSACVVTAPPAVGVGTLLEVTVRLNDSHGRPLLCTSKQLTLSAARGGRRGASDIDSHDSDGDDVCADVAVGRWVRVSSAEPSPSASPCDVAAGEDGPASVWTWRCTPRVPGQLVLRIACNDVILTPAGLQVTVLPGRRHVADAPMGVLVEHAVCATMPHTYRQQDDMPLSTRDVYCSTADGLRVCAELSPPPVGGDATVSPPPVGGDATVPPPQLHAEVVDVLTGGVMCVSQGRVRPRPAHTSMPSMAVTTDLLHVSLGGQYTLRAWLACAAPANDSERHCVREWRLHVVRSDIAAFHRAGVLALPPTSGSGGALAVDPALIYAVPSAPMSASTGLPDDDVVLSQVNVLLQPQGRCPAYLPFSGCNIGSDAPRSPDGVTLVTAHAGPGTLVHRTADEVKAACRWALHPRQPPHSLMLAVHVVAAQVVAVTGGRASIVDPEPSATGSGVDGEPAPSVLPPCITLCQLCELLAQRSPAAGWTASTPSVSTPTAAALCLHRCVLAQLVLAAVCGDASLPLREHLTWEIVRSPLPSLKFSFAAAPSRAYVVDMLTGATVSLE